MLLYGMNRIEARTYLRSKAGFTLVEILIVVVIAALIAAGAIPSTVKYIQNNNLKSAARCIQNDFYEYRSRATAENTSYQISFNTGSVSYTITKTSDNSTVGTKVLTDFDSGLTMTSVTYGGNAVTFQPRGTTDAAGTVVLTNRRSSTATIRSTITGKAYVQYSMQ